MSRRLRMERCVNTPVDERSEGEVSDSSTPAPQSRSSSVSLDSRPALLGHADSSESSTDDDLLGSDPEREKTHHNDRALLGQDHRSPFRDDSEQHGHPPATVSVSASPVSVRHSRCHKRPICSPPRTPRLRSRSPSRGSSPRRVVLPPRPRRATPAPPHSPPRKARKREALPRIEPSIPTLKGRDNPLPEDEPQSVLDRLLPDRKRKRPNLRIGEEAINRWLEIRQDTRDSSLDLEELRQRVIVHDPNRYFEGPEVPQRYRKLMAKDRREHETRLFSVQDDLLAATRALAAYYGAALDRASQYTQRLDKGRSVKSKHTTVSFDVVKFTRDMDTALQLLAASSHKLSLLRADQALGSLAATLRGHMSAAEAIQAAPSGALVPDDLTSQAKVEQEFKRRDALEKQKKASCYTAIGHSPPIIDLTRSPPPSRTRQTKLCVTFRTDRVQAPRAVTRSRDGSTSCPQPVAVLPADIPSAAAAPLRKGRTAGASNHTGQTRKATTMVPERAAAADSHPEGLRSHRHTPSPRGRRNSPLDKLPINSPTPPSTSHRANLDPPSSPGRRPVTTPAPLEVPRSTGFGQFLAAEGIQGELANFLIGAYKPNTNLRYDKIYAHYAAWCEQHAIVPYQATVAQVVAYLHDKFHYGVQYATLATTVSALGHHLQGPLPNLAKKAAVQLFMRSVFLKRPPRAKQFPAWQIRDLLDFWRGDVGPRELDMAHLARKTAGLLAIVWAARSECLSKLSLERENFRVGSESIVFTLAELPKGARPSSRLPQTELTLHKHGALALDPFRHVLEYVRRTASQRNQQSRLFLSLRPPYRPATAATIAGWLRWTLTRIPAGNLAGGHTMRCVSASHAQKAGVSLHSIMSAAQWKNADTFFRHYRIPDAHEALQRAILPDEESEPELEL